MSPSPDSTAPSHRIPAVVLISPEPDTIAACQEAVRSLPEAPALKIADVPNAATMVAEWRPFAVLVSESVFAFDPREFESLAQTVGAEVMVIGANEERTELRARLVHRLRASLSFWHSRRTVSP